MVKAGALTITFIAKSHSLKLSENGSNFKLGLAQYKFDKIKGRPASEITWNGKIFGNPIDANGNYLNNFNITNISAEIKTTIGTRSIPTLFFIIL